MKNMNYFIVFNSLLNYSTVYFMFIFNCIEFSLYGWDMV